MERRAASPSELSESASAEAAISTKGATRLV
jgi:hypothetical protein